MRARPPSPPAFARRGLANGATGRVGSVMMRPVSAAMGRAMERSKEVNAYIARLPPERRAEMEALRAFVHQAIGEGRETIWYRMPAFEAGGLVCTIAAQARHYAVYVCDPALLDAYRARFAGLDLGKGCIRFQAFDAVPREALHDILQEAARNPGWRH